LLVNVPEPGLDELNLLTIVAVPLIFPFAPVLVAVAVITVILAAIIRADIVLEGAVSLRLELVENVRIHAHHLVGRQPHSRRRTLCTSPGVTTAVDSMENSVTAAAVPVAIR
jgi:cobalamin biosynthesis protein CobD/CbiB